MPDLQVRTRDRWLAARRELLARERELTRQRDAVNAARRRLPMVEITKHYSFTAPRGEISLLDLLGQETTLRGRRSRKRSRPGYRRAQRCRRSASGLPSWQAFASKSKPPP
jgi:hypothetical protein